MTSAWIRGEWDTVPPTETPLRQALVAYCASFLRVLGNPDVLAATRLVIAEGRSSPPAT